MKMAALTRVAWWVLISLKVAWNLSFCALFKIKSFHFK